MHYIVDLMNKFEEIKNTKGKDKETVIEKYKDDFLFKETLFFVYNPYIPSGIAKKKINKKVDISCSETFETLPSWFSYLKNNNSVTDRIIAELQLFINNQPEETHEFLKNVFTQDLQIGADVKTINKVMGDFIPTHQVQSAMSYADNREKFTTGEYAISLKLDGYRATVKNDENDFRIWAKSGRSFEGLVELEEQLRQLPKGFVYDGELLYIDDSIPTHERYRKTQSILKSKGEKKDIVFIMFDVINIEEFNKGESDTKYSSRLMFMNHLIDNYKHLNLIQKVPIFYVGNDHSKIPLFTKYVESKGYEGLILNDMNSKYKCKRHEGIMKVKQFYTIDLAIIGCEEHKHGNKLGAFIVDYKGNEVRVGGGFTDKERVEFWQRRHEYIGKIIEVEYFQESKNKNDGVSMRSPNFLRFRWDKIYPSHD